MPSFPIACLMLCATLPAAAAGLCEARSGAVPPAVVELYTSEGCSSCPPADRWLSTLKGRDDVISLAFHVNYWDRLGWPDRYATAEGTERQRQVQRTSGATYVYTPQVVVDGRDWRGWPAALPHRAAAGAPALGLQHDGDAVVATIAAAPGAGPRLGGYWAVLEDGATSTVRAGENAGSTLKHDSIVRLYQPVADWAATQAQRVVLKLPAAAAGAATRRVVFVVTDAATQRPVQAVSLGC